MAEAIGEGTLLAGLYRIERQIGEGGFGTVYRARQLPLGREVAVKVMPAEALLVPQRLARFEREAALLMRLEHPNTARLLDYGVSEQGAPFIVMELLRGESLAELIAREGAQSPARTARLAGHVLKALMEAHALGIVHRDIKPANIFITEHAGEPFFAKLLDFGIAKQTGEDATASTRRPEELATEAPSITNAGQSIGTPRYMAPEQAFGEVVTPSTDLYSLGLTLAEMLAGQPVIQSESVAEIYAMHASTAPLPLELVVVGSPLGGVIARATAKAPSDRFSTAGEMLAAIEGQADSGAPGWTQIPLSKLVDTTSIGVAKTQATPLATVQMSPPKKRGIAPYAVVGGVAVALSIGAVAVVPRIWRQPRTPLPAPLPSVVAAPSAPLESHGQQAKFVPQTNDELVALLEGAGWKAISPAVQNQAAFVAGVRKGKCAGSVMLAHQEDEPHAKLMVENLHVSATAYPSFYDGNAVLAINIGAADPGANPEECQRDLESILLRP